MIEPRIDAIAPAEPVAPTGRCSFIFERPLGEFEVLRVVEAGLCGSFADGVGLGFGGVEDVVDYGGVLF